MWAWVNTCWRLSVWLLLSAKYNRTRVMHLGHRVIGRPAWTWTRQLRLDLGRRGGCWENIIAGYVDWMGVGEMNTFLFVCVSIYLFVSDETYWTDYIQIFRFVFTLNYKLSSILTIILRLKNDQRIGNVRKSSLKYTTSPAESITHFERMPKLRPRQKKLLSYNINSILVVTQWKKCLAQIT